MSLEDREIDLDRFLSAERERSHEIAKEILGLDNLVILDTETTGLDGFGEVVQIAVIDRDGSVICDTFIRPTVPIPSEATAIHGIEDLHVQEAPTMADLYPSLRNVLGNAHVAIYNADFDLRLINQSLWVHGLPEVYRQPIGPRYQQGDLVIDSTCIMHLYSSYAGEWHDYFQSFTWQSLANAIHQCGLSFEGTPHTALADARATLSILRYMATNLQTYQIHGGN